VPHHPQPGYKRDARMDKSIIIHMIIRTPSRVSLQTFINFVYLYVNKQFTTKTLLKREFKSDIYEKTNWICGCVDTNRLFCFPCLLFAQGNAEYSWTKTGVNDLGHFAQKIKK
jgi:hypothetical protein